MARVFQFVLIHLRGATVIDHAGLIDHRHMRARQAERLEQPQASGRGRTGPRADQLDRVEFFTDQPQGITDRGSGDNRSAMLVVMKNRDPDPFA